MAKTIAMPTRQLVGEKLFVGGVHNNSCTVRTILLYYTVCTVVSWYCGGRHGSLCGVRVFCEREGVLLLCRCVVAPTYRVYLGQRGTCWDYFTWWCVSCGVVLVGGVGNTVQ